VLIQALIDRFEDYFGGADRHDTVLWFDPEGEYAALLGHLPELALWRYEGSLLQVRYRLLQRAPGGCCCLWRTSVTSWTSPATCWTSCRSSFSPSRSTPPSGRWGWSR
jgi:hypothetical protein